MAAGLPDLIALDSEWVDEYGQPIGNSVSVYQGEPVEYYMMIVTDSDVIGYKVWLTQNGHAIDTITPHTNINDNHYFAYEAIDTSSYAPGDYTVKVGANNDGVENAYDETRYLYLEILPIEEVNEPPYTPSNPSPVDGQTAVGTEGVMLVWTGGDPDGDEVTYDVLFGEDGELMTLIAEDISETFFWNDENLDFETSYNWMIVSKDSEFDIAGYVWSFTTRAEDVEENHDPVIENIENQRAKCNRNFRLWVDVDDEDNDDLTFYDNTDLFNIDSETGEISFKPDCSDRGTYHITITVVDEHGGEDSETFRLRIYREGSGDDDDDDDGDNIESVIEYGECIEDNDGDNLGIRQVIYTLLDSNSGGFISVQSSQEICQLVVDEIPVYEFRGFLEDELVTVILVIIIFLMITIPLALYVFNKLS